MSTLTLVLPSPSFSTKRTVRVPRVGLGGVGVLEGDVAHQRRGAGRVGVRVQRHDQRGAAGAAAEAADERAAVADVGAGHADLPGAAALVADRQHVLGGVAAGGERHGQRAGVEVRRVGCR